MTKSSKPEMPTIAQRAVARGDAAYQFAVCLGLALMAGFAGTAGAFMAHGAI